MVIFNSYVSLPEGIAQKAYRWKIDVPHVGVQSLISWTNPAIMSLAILGISIPAVAPAVAQHHFFVPKESMGTSIHPLVDHDFLYHDFL